MSSTLKSSLPEDRIYAILGLANDSDSISISPDYSKPLYDLYTEVAEKLLLSKISPVQILSHAGIGYSRKVSELPSWAPDWSSPPANRIFSVHMPPNLLDLLYQRRNSLPIISRQTTTSATLRPEIQSRGLEKELFLVQWGLRASKSESSRI
jgi:hypothetical protein